MTINANSKYLLVPQFIEGISMKAKEMTGKELLKEFKEEYLIKALEDAETTLFYKGNEYYLDEAVSEEVNEES